MYDIKMIAIAVVLGIIVTVLTTFVNSTPSGGLIGSAWYGWPLAWNYQAVGALGAPWSINYVNMIIDVVVWSVIFFVIMFIAMHVMKKK